jgi:hypothetical protein
MKDLTVSFNGLLQDKRVRSEQSKYENIQRQRATATQKYKRAYQEFLDLQAGLGGARTWYADMKDAVESLEKNVETFVNNRRAEGAQLLEQIEQEKAANKSAQAALEQERLRGLMERMAVEPANTSANTGTARAARPIPAPLSFSSQDMYPQKTFGGQYQTPSSPPPQQMHTPYSAHPSSYDPSHYPRNAGPVSPQPNQTSFGQKAMRPGPASPPPMQTSFNGGVQTLQLRPHPQSPPPMQTSFGGSIHRQNPASPPPTQTSFPGPSHGRPFSTYGNPAAQAQSPAYVPPGFVPPPPPPGPPPLGPQQTIHYQGQPNEYAPYSAVPQSARPGSAQPQGQGHDPWAGLNAWK